MRGAQLQGGSPLSLVKGMQLEYGKARQAAPEIRELDSRFPRCCACRRDQLPAGVVQLIAKIE